VRSREEVERLEPNRTINILVVVRDLLLLCLLYLGLIVTLCLSWFLAAVYVLLESALVNYVVPGAFPPTTHSGDTALMRFRAFT